VRFDQVDRVAIVLCSRRELAAGSGIAFDQSGKPREPFLVGRIVGDSESGGDVRRCGRFIAIEPADGAIDFARRDGEAHFPGFELHAARMVRGAQRFGGRVLFVVGFAASQRRAVFPDLLIDQHPGHQQDADGCSCGELGPNRTIQNRHRPNLFKYQGMINGPS
jgi:hypothetical protein